MTTKEVLECAFQIIGFAGDAFDCYNSTIKSAINGNYEEANKYLEEGKEAMKNAHQVQTDLLIREARGEEIPYALTMVHAQDHLMNAYLTETLAKQAILLMESVDKKITSNK